ncbi:MAG: YbaB/EbfC family nucleoid-associated protein [Candidatus Paceibacterota bacterium]|jgi:DNA-binding protein YbaB
MFDKLKQIQELRKIQSAAKEEKTEVEKNGVRVILNGNFEIEKITLNPELAKEIQEKILEECLNEAVKKIQLSLAKKFSSLI